MTREQLAEEPCAAKVASTVLKTSGRSDPLTEFHRALRRSVIFRKNSLFFRSEHGAAVADVLMSAIETCNLNRNNPFEYLMTVMKNARDVRANTNLWMPWDFQERLSSCLKVDQVDNFLQSSTNCAV